MMKNLVWLLSFLLIIWIVLASYLYVCKIRDHCGTKDAESSSEMLMDATAGTDTLETAVDVRSDSIVMAKEYLDEIGTKTYYFEFASSELTPSRGDEEYFTALKTYLRSSPDHIIDITGHADIRGSDAANDRFGRLRAEAVRDYFIANGIDGDQIRTLSKGAADPAASNDTEEGRSLNRRAEITLN